MPWPTRRPLLLAASPSIALLAASLGWALIDRLRLSRRTVWTP